MAVIRRRTDRQLTVAIPHFVLDASRSETTAHHFEGAAVTRWLLQLDNDVLMLLFVIQFMNL